MKDSIESTSLVWKQIAYMWNNYFTVPSCISPDELKQYRKWLRKINEGKKPLKGLVLGATPNLRDALYDFGFKVYSIDINLDMFLAMEELLKNKNNKEVLIKSDWLNNPLKDNFFDVVLGDAVLPNVPWDKRQKLLSEVKRMLKPNGFFLTRAFCVPHKKRFSTVEQILRYFSKKSPTMQSALEMVLELQILAYDPKDHQGSFAKSKQLLEDYHAINGRKFKNTGLQSIHDIVWQFWCDKFIDKVFIYDYRQEEEKDYRKYFKILEDFEARDHNYSDITPLYLLGSKN